MADDAPQSTSQKVERAWKRYVLIAAIVGAFSGGGVLGVMTYFTETVEMFSRPGDVVKAANQVGTVDWLVEVVCFHHPEECEE